MLLSARTARRAVAGAVGTGAIAGAMLFGALPTAQTIGVPGAALPASPSPAAAVTHGTGPLPGPSTVTSR